MIPTVFTKNKVKIANASSLESYLGVGSNSAYEGLEDAKVNDKVVADGEVELEFFLQEAIANLLIDGRIFFSKEPEKAYDELLECLQKPEIKALVLRILDKAEIFDDLSMYRLLEERSHQTNLEAQERSKALEAFRAKLLEARPELENKLD